jgi:hypothetical protein
MRLIGALASASLALAVASCGGDGSSGNGSLTAAERARVAQAERQINSYCASLALALRRGRPAATVETGPAFAAVDELSALARMKPDAVAARRRTTRELLGDIAEDLEGSNCSPPLLARIGQVLAGLPPENAAGSR